MTIGEQRITLVPACGRSAWINDESVKCKAVTEDKLGAYSLFEIVVAPQGGPPANTNHWEEAYYILEGELLIQLGDRTFTATAGSFVDVSKGILHTFKNVGSVPARLLAIVTPAWYGKFFEEWIGVSTKKPRLRHLRLLKKSN